MHLGKHTTSLLESRIHFSHQLNAWACRVCLKRENTNQVSVLQKKIKDYIGFKHTLLQQVAVLSEIFTCKNLLYLL